MINKIIILLLCFFLSCTYEKDIHVWSQKLCLESIRTVQRASGVYYDHVWADGRIRYTERRIEKLTVGECKIFLVR